MLNTKFIKVSLSALLLLSLTAFVPTPKLSLETDDQRFKFNATNFRYPFSKANTNLDIEVAQKSTIKHSPLLTITRNSVEIATVNGKKDLALFSAQNLYFLPTGVSEDKNVVKIAEIQDFLNNSAPIKLHSKTHTNHVAEPYFAPVSLDESYVVGSLCLPASSDFKHTNPFFIAYGNSIDPNLQRIPYTQRAKTYTALVNKYASKYRLPTSLVYAIMHVESGFNPNAVSPSRAHGLMQIVVETAGKEVHDYLGKSSALSPNLLHQPEFNVEYGTAYLYLLHTRHLSRIKNPLSREYCAIASYNGGSSRVIRLFGYGESAYTKINSLSPQEVYNTIRRSFPSDETRRYLQKVVAVKQTYSTLY